MPRRVRRVIRNDLDSSLSSPRLPLPNIFTSLMFGPDSCLATKITSFTLHLPSAQPLSIILHLSATNSSCSIYIGRARHVSAIHHHERTYLHCGIHMGVERLFLSSSCRAPQLIAHRSHCIKAWLHYLSHSPASLFGGHHRVSYSQKSRLQRPDVSSRARDCEENWRRKADRSARFWKS